MSLIGKFFNIGIARKAGVASLVSLKIDDFTHEAGATTATNAEKFDVIGSSDDSYNVSIAYPNASVPAPTTSIADLISAATAAVDAKYGATEGRVVPGAPTIGTAVKASAVAVDVAFTPPAANGGSAITGYTAVSTPGNLTASGASSPIRVSGLSDGVDYTFTVVATNAVGNSPKSAASNSITAG